MSAVDPELPPLADDRVAMMLGLVPDKRTPEERLLDAIRTNGESMRYRYCGAVSPEGRLCDRTDEHETHTRLMDCGCTETWTDAIPVAPQEYRGAVMSDVAEEREHIESADCWCRPTVEYVPAAGHDLDCEKSLHGWSICECHERRGQ